ncbi:HEAT repeat domain-containing protein [Akkermansiaceae bacterium]|nr:HEAT repeat domain-containing protein [Akkermansiaceae bacterium]
MIRILPAFLSALLIIPCHAAGPRGAMPNPDFTKGDPIPEGARHDWTLGATGMRGWMFSDKLETSDARQISITIVDKGSPADGILAVGDVILGVAGKKFSYDPRTEFGKALTAAEEKSGELSLIAWKAGKEQTVSLKLPVLGAYSATAPFDCPKSALILKQGCTALAERMGEPGYERQSPITRSLNALALLAGGNPQHLPLVKREAEWAAGFSDEGMATWYYGYVITLLAEYHMATGDDSVKPGLRRLAMEAATGQSIVGSWGHKFAGGDGRLVGYGMMNAPGVPLTTSLVLARKAGVNDPEISMAIERSMKLLRFYVGKGSIPYGDHAPWMENHDDNGKNGMAAVLFNILDETAGAEYFSRMSLACHGNERDTGHTGNFWNMTWAVPGIVQSGPHATGAWMKEFGAWSFDLARRWDGAFPHQGPPEKDGDSTRGWDATGAYLLAYAMPLKKTVLTGKRPSIVPQLDPKEAASIINDGKGWSNKNRFAAYDALAGDELLECLGSWSPVVRNRAAMAIARRKDRKATVPALIALLGSTSLETRYGACEALTKLGGDAAPALPALRNLLKEKDMWLRVEAAEALAAIGQPAMATLPDLLTMLAVGPTKEDPRGMEQRYLSFAVFGTMLRQASLEGVDKDLLFRAVTAGLKNEDGRARGSIGSVYRKLSHSEIEPLLPAVLNAVVHPAPSGIMFADQIRMEGLQILSAHRAEEGIRACADYISLQNPWASEKRTPEILKILLSYGAHAKKVVPDLEKTAATFAAGERGFPKHLSLQKAENLRDAIKTINASTDLPKLTRIQATN